MDYSLPKFDKTSDELWGTYGVLTNFKKSCQDLEGASSMDCYDTCDLYNGANGLAKCGKEGREVLSLYRLAGRVSPHLLVLL
jgi:hypothetical protein